MATNDDLDLAALFCTMRKRGDKWVQLRWPFIVAIVLSCVLAACTVPVARPPSVGGQAPDGFPVSYYQQLSQRGSEVLQIDPAQSLIVMEVRRAGSLANLGHDHVVASHDVRGYVAPGETRGDFYIRLDQLVVDEPALRTEAGFETQPPDSAIAGTRENMLRKFNAEAHPYAVVSVTRAVVDTGGTQQLETSIALNGVTRTVRVPAKVEQVAGQITVSGRVALAQTAFEITPFSILGGALQVQDQVDVRFTIRARSLQP